MSLLSSKHYSRTCFLSNGILFRQAKKRAEEKERRGKEKISLTK
jgi:hypothetical protein